MAIMAAAAEEGDLPKFELSCEAKKKLNEGFTKVRNKARGDAQDLGQDSPRWRLTRVLTSGACSSSS